MGCCRGDVIRISWLVGLLGDRPYLMHLCVSDDVIKGPLVLDVGVTWARHTSCLTAVRKPEPLPNPGSQ